MGLDITAYRQLKHAPEAAVEFFFFFFSVDYEHFTLIPQSTLDWTEEHWLGRTEGLKAGVFSFTESHGFRAGSYSGYNWWRSKLCELAYGVSAEKFWERDDIEPGAFFELIHFADNEGYIGPVVGAKLAKDFAEWESRAAEFAKAIVDASEGKYWLIRYGDWKKAFELAADGGCVDFH